MKSHSVKQFAIVRSDSAPHFTDELNAKMVDLIGKDPEVRITENGNVLTAQITYTIKVETEPEQKDITETGIKFTCEQCPFFEPVYKADGTIDNRIKYGFCECSETGKVFKDSAACQKLYGLIQNGGIGLCFR